MRAELGGRRFGKGVLVLGDHRGDGGSAMAFFFKRLRVAGWELENDSNRGGAVWPIE